MAKAHAAKTATTQPGPEALEMIGSKDVLFKLDKPEIYFIEDQMNHLTNSLILDVSKTCKHTTLIQVYHVKITDNLKALSLIEQGV